VPPHRQIHVPLIPSSSLSPMVEAVEGVWDSRTQAEGAPTQSLQGR